MIYLVRHGETSYNRDGLGLGRADVALTELGRAQAKAASERLRTVAVQRVLASPLERAAHAGRLVAASHGLGLETVDALTELDVGETEGLTFADMRDRFPDFLAKWASNEGWRERMPGGESLRDLADRLEPLAAGLLAEQGAEVVIASHNFTLRVLMCLLLGLELHRFRSFEIGLASITTLAVRNSRVAVRNVNDSCHLAGLSVA